MKTLIVLSCMLASLNVGQDPFIPVDGAWSCKDENGRIQVLILADGHYALTTYDAGAFVSTRGGKFKTERFKGGARSIIETVEFNTSDPAQVGTEQRVLVLSFEKKDPMIVGEKRENFLRLDDGKPGQLAGAWVITGRVSNGELRTMTPGARRTMKILSGTRFQWIAYNVETREFSGTGGGTYTTVDGKYTESIEFFSRDNSRVGASLSFDFALEGKTWRHKGLSSKGEPIDEVWSRRSDIGL